ncbi:MAG: aspartate aminotransferase family protein [Pseudobacteriovorax sp.]|nr:aspartate aminotransferase family protein [Pseudobacteriovorax sp.]
MMSNAQYMERLSQIECHDSTFPCHENPLVFAKANGSKVWDVESREYLDLCAGFGVMNLGHNPSFQRDVFHRFAESGLEMVHGMGDVYPSRAKVDFIDAMLALLPDKIRRAALSLSGAGSVEIALKTCLLRKPNGKIVVFDGGYHGLDLGVLPLASRSDFKSPFEGWLPRDQVITVPFDIPEELLRKTLSDNCISGMVVEPVQGRSGVKIPSQGWLAVLRAVADDYNALLVFDEIFTGCGRIGSFSSSHEVLPDLLCLGKALGGGLPLSSCCGTEEAFSHWPKSNGEAIHTGTFFGHPLSCELGSAFLETFQRENLAEKSAVLGLWALKYLENQVGGHHSVFNIRGKGLMIAIELAPGKGVDLMNRLREKGIIALVSGSSGEVLSLTPALNISQSTFEQGLSLVCDCIRKI